MSIYKIQKILLHFEVLGVSEFLFWLLYIRIKYGRVSCFVPGCAFAYTYIRSHIYIHIYDCCDIYTTKPHIYNACISVLVVCVYSSRTTSALPTPPLWCILFVTECFVQGCIHMYTVWVTLEEHVKRNLLRCTLGFCLLSTLHYCIILLKLFYYLPLCSCICICV